MTDVTVNGVPPKYVPLAWDRVEPMLGETFSRYSDETADSALADLLAGNTQLWVVGDFEAICITQIAQRQLAKVLWFYYVTGEGSERWLQPLIDTVSAFAVEKGCTQMEFTGRKGWAKILPKFGFEETLVTMKAPLNG